MREWRQPHFMVEATLQCIDLEDRIESDDRIVLNIIPDDESSLFTLLDRVAPHSCWAYEPA